MNKAYERGNASYSIFVPGKLRVAVAQLKAAVDATHEL
jgi:hypothetical protein